MESDKTQNIDIRSLAVNGGQIKGLPRNPRLIRDARFEKLKQSLKDSPEFMNLRPVIAVSQGDGRPAVVICGNMRLRACIDLGWTEVPTIVLPGDTPVEKLREYAIKDNVPYGETDWDVVANEWDTSELEGWGFEMPEDWGETPCAGDDGFTEEDAERAEAVCKLGEVWKLGEHRLMCGDSTDPDAVATLMGGERADICFTSPPYGVGEDTAYLRKHLEKGKNKRDGKTFYGDNSDDSNTWAKLMNGFFTQAQKYTDSQFVNVMMVADNKRDLIDFVHNNAQNFVDCIVWNKHTCPPQAHSNVLNNAYEFVFVFDNENNTRAIRYGDFKGSVSNYIETDRENNEFADIHKAVFSVAFATRILEMNSTSKSVYDPFGGSGTTLIAAEQLNRKCFMMELEPRYCDVIIARWEKLTGNKAEKMV